MAAFPAAAKANPDAEIDAEFGDWREGLANLYATRGDYDEAMLDAVDGLAGRVLTAPTTTARGLALKVLADTRFGDDEIGAGLLGQLLEITGATRPDYPILPEPDPEPEPEREPEPELSAIESAVAEHTAFEFAALSDVDSPSFSARVARADGALVRLMALEPATQAEADYRRRYLKVLAARGNVALAVCKGSEA